MLRNLATSLINAHEERIVTTLPKAKELRPFVERVITLSRRAQQLTGDDAGAGALHLRRQAAAFFHAGNTERLSISGRRGQVPLPRTAGMAALKRLFDELGDRYKDRPGGYTRIFKLGRRVGDNAELAIIELVDNPREREHLEAATKRAKAAAGKKKTGKAKDGKAKPEKVAAKTKAEEISAFSEAESESSEKLESDTPEQDKEQ
jgi:large subunit ribosomal protein L17